MPEASRSRKILKSCGSQHSVVVTAASAPSHSTEDDKEADFPKGRCCRVYDPICGLVEAPRPATVWARSAIVSSAQDNRVSKLDELTRFFCSTPVLKGERDA